jgi:hypothetical protein
MWMLMPPQLATWSCDLFGRVKTGLDLWSYVPGLPSVITAHILRPERENARLLLVCAGHGPLPVVRVDVNAPSTTILRDRLGRCAHLRPSLAACS